MFHIVIAKNLSNLQNLNPRKFCFGSSFMLSISSKPNCQLSLYGSHTCGWLVQTRYSSWVVGWWIAGVTDWLVGILPSRIDEASLWILSSGTRYKNKNSSESLCWALEMIKREDSAAPFSRLVQNSELSPSLQLNVKMKRIQMKHSCSWLFTATFSYGYIVVSTHDLSEPHLPACRNLVSINLKP